MSEKLKILIADDQKLIREGPKVLLEVEEDFEIIGEAINGIESIKKIKEVNPQVKIIILTTFDDDQYVYDGLKSGALGYILKDTSIEKLSETIKIVHKGGAIIEPSITKKILSEISKIEKEEFIEELNLREIVILKFISKGYTNQEIADKLNPSVGTVKNYVTTILQKIGARDRTEAALIAKEIGII